MPQLVNILRGQMSWVGPRTVSVGQVEAHSSWLPNLLTVKPGITGSWAVVDEHSLDEEMRLTMYYIRNWTIWLDLQILARRRSASSVVSGIRRGCRRGRGEGKRGKGRKRRKQGK